MPALGRRGARTDLGPGYHRVWTAVASSTLGDGVFLAALPLLSATLSRDPLQVSLVAFAGWLPWLLFGLISGALVDRWDRRQVMWAVDAVRAILVGGLALAVLAGWASIPLLAAIGFLLGTGQTLVDNAALSLIPALVGRDRQRLERANSQLYALGTWVSTLSAHQLVACCSRWPAGFRSWSMRCRLRPARPWSPGSAATSGPKAPPTALALACAPTSLGACAGCLPIGCCAPWLCWWD